MKNNSNRIVNSLGAKIINNNDWNKIIVALLVNQNSW